MAFDRYLLSWDNFAGRVMSLMDELRASDALVDVTLCCADLHVGVHRLVLSACSPYFRTLLQNNPCQHMVFYMKDTSASDLRALVEFMYRGSVNVSQSQLASFIKTAESLQIRGLSGDEENKSAKFSNSNCDGGRVGGNGDIGASQLPPPPAPRAVCNDMASPPSASARAASHGSSPSFSRQQQQQQQQQVSGKRVRNVSYDAGQVLLSHKLRAIDRQRRHSMDTALDDRTSAGAGAGAAAGTGAGAAAGTGAGAAAGTGAGAAAGTGAGAVAGTGADSAAGTCSGTGTSAVKVEAGQCGVANGSAVEPARQPAEHPRSVGNRDDSGGADVASSLPSAPAAVTGSPSSVDRLPSSLPTLQISGWSPLASGAGGAGGVGSSSGGGRAGGGGGDDEALLLRSRRVYLCKRCGRPANHDTGHRRYSGHVFCPVHPDDGLDYEQWVARLRSCVLQRRSLSLLFPGALPPPPPPSSSSPPLL